MPGADFVLHNSLFLVAHFHNVIIGGVVFGCLAGMSFWFPKVFGFTLDEFWGKVSFWCWLIGYWLAFTPLYILGFKGMTRRMNHYDVAGLAPVSGGGADRRGDHRRWASWRMIVQLAVSIRDRKKNRDLTGDPWDARSLEWAHRLAGAVLQLRPRSADHLAGAALGRQADRPCPRAARVVL